MKLAHCCDQHISNLSLQEERSPTTCPQCKNEIELDIAPAQYGRSHPGDEEIEFLHEEKILAGAKYARTPAIIFEKTFDNESNASTDQIEAMALEAYLDLFPIYKDPRYKIEAFTTKLGSTTSVKIRSLIQ